MSLPQKNPPRQTRGSSSQAQSALTSSLKVPICKGSVKSPPTHGSRPARSLFVFFFPIFVSFLSCICRSVLSHCFQYHFPNLGSIDTNLVHYLYPWVGLGGRWPGFHQVSLSGRPIPSFMSVWADLPPIGWSTDCSRSHLVCGGLSLPASKPFEATTQSQSTGVRPVPCGLQTPSTRSAHLDNRSLDGIGPLAKRGFAWTACAWCNLHLLQNGPFEPACKTAVVQSGNRLGLIWMGNQKVITLIAISCGKQTSTHV